MDLQWHWAYLGAAGEAGASSGFPDQAEAEAWLGEMWTELLAEGVLEVVLVEGERRVYGPMRLNS